MKTLIFAALVTLTFAAQANAYVGPNPIPRRVDVDPACQIHNDCWPTWPRGNYPNHVSVACAPEIVDGNVKATDRTLKALAETSDFADAKTFRAQISKIASQKTSAEKADKYLALVGIDSTNTEDVVEFIGARNVKSAWLASLEKNSGLNSKQAEVVAAKLQTVLRGGLQ